MGYEPGMGPALLVVLLLIGLFGIGSYLLPKLADLWTGLLEGLLGTDDYEDRNPSYK